MHEGSGRLRAAELSSDLPESDSPTDSNAPRQDSRMVLIMRYRGGGNASGGRTLESSRKRCVMMQDGGAAAPIGGVGGRWRTSHGAQIGRTGRRRSAHGRTRSICGRIEDEASTCGWRGSGRRGRPKRAAHETQSVARMEQCQESSGGRAAAAAATAAVIRECLEDLRAEKKRKRQMPKQVARVTESVTSMRRAQESATVAWRVMPEDVGTAVIALAKDFGAVLSAQEMVCWWILNFAEVHC